MQKRVGELERGENGRRELGQGKDQALGGIVSHFLLLRDQAACNRRFEDIEGKKSNPIFPLCDFWFWRKALTWEKEVYIDSNPLLELFKLDSMVGYDIHEFGWSYLSFCG